MFKKDDLSKVFITVIDCEHITNKYPVHGKICDNIWQNPLGFKTTFSFWTLRFTDYV